ncbi:unnamed protein product, partial [Didymodactylos carnosus]
IGELLNNGRVRIRRGSGPLTVAPPMGTKLIRVTSDDSDPSGIILQLIINPNASVTTALRVNKLKVS